MLLITIWQIDIRLTGLAERKMTVARPFAQGGRIKISLLALYQIKPHSFGSRIAQIPTMQMQITYLRSLKPLGSL